MRQETTGFWDGSGISWTKIKKNSGALNRAKKNKEGLKYSANVRAVSDNTGRSVGREFL